MIFLSRHPIVLALVLLLSGAAITVALALRPLQAHVVDAPPERIDGALLARALGERPLRIGVPWLPPPDTPDMRLYVEEGFELDLAAEIAGRFGVEHRLIRIAPGDAARALASAEVDLVLTRIAEDDPLRQATLIVETGYQSGQSLATRSDRPLTSWDALKGQTVCVSQANGQGRELAERLGARVTSVRAPAPALMQMRTGDCVAALHDRALLEPLLAKASWQKFSATLPPVESTALVVAVAPAHARLAEAVGRILATAAAPLRWRQQAEKWASTVSFEVYRDQVAADCH